MPDWAGEQFATPDAIRPLRAARNRRRKSEEAGVATDGDQVQS